ncbi:polysaccharide deacetylase family protein [Amycolatopsis rifamycinica]|uniref:NodB homology domain-containing protein n=1 Tax=Amycolatopsis rifamycinica TaxID=287986 RepID=A0A066TMC7_9PSEU|nr:hypothetical protein [Amycolatopsis rifamycinica]KDN16030.1 hypothetical protein DV20_43060 [Amycolatopsis rifamycinica]
MRAKLELRFTDLALAGAAGVGTSLVRPPYSAAPAAVDDAAWASMRRIGADGRLVVLSDVDSQDRRRPGVAAIVANVTPKDDRGAVVLMHDAGGDRSETVAALADLVPRLRAAGWTFGTVGEVTGVREAVSPAAPAGRAGGWCTTSSSACRPCRARSGRSGARRCRTSAASRRTPSPRTPT